MKNFQDITVRVSAKIYQQLQQIWQVGYDQSLFSYLDHTALEAQQLAKQLNCEEAAQWIHLHPTKYSYAQPSGHWGLDTGKFDGTVVCQRIGEIGTTALTNVPRTCIQHSPNGHEWGYGGSGPADLALDILNWFCPPAAHEKPVKCFKGFSSEVAWDLHQEFKREVIGQLHREGVTIKAETIRMWLINNQI